LNSNGENDITALADVSDFKGAGNGIADMFLLEGGDNIKLRKIVSKILNDPDRKDRLYNQICDSMIMDYKTDAIGIDDIEIGNDDVPQG